jgi:hypothetical protein
VRATITLTFPPDCWLFIQDRRRAPLPEPLSADVEAVLGLPPRMEIWPPVPEPRFVVSMTQPQAAALHRWLRALLEELSREDPRWPTCLQCISRVAGALRLSEL